MANLKEQSCADRVEARCAARLRELSELWAQATEDPWELYSYGLSFDYVLPGTFTDQVDGYFRYQISWGGPSDEFRFYTTVEHTVDYIEYWFLDWGDGASRVLKNEDAELMREIFEHFRDIGTVEHVFERAHDY